MKKRKLRIIPFIISILIVVGSMMGINQYMYKDFEPNKVNFIEEYSRMKNVLNPTSEEKIENFIKWESKYYKQLTNEIKFYDVKSNNEYTDTPSLSSKNLFDNVVYKDGVLHIPNYFDIKFYLEATEATDDTGLILSIYAFVYNVNYKTEYSLDGLRLVIAQGIGESAEDEELMGTTKINKIFKEIELGKNETANMLNYPQYNYQGELYNYKDKITDPQAYGAFSESDNYIGRLVTLTISKCSTPENGALDTFDSTGLIMSDLENATFSIYNEGLDGQNYERILNGTFTNSYKDTKDFLDSVKNNEDNIQKGYSKDFKAAGFNKYFFKAVWVWELVTFIVSSIIAVLFYLIWMDDEPNPRKRKATN